MKKKVLSGVFVLALLATAGFGVNKSMNSDVNLNDLALSNVEALAAGGETGGLASACCPIWNITMEIGGYLVFPKVICNTGGSYKCQDCSCGG